MHFIFYFKGFKITQESLYLLFSNGNSNIEYTINNYNKWYIICEFLFWKSETDSFLDRIKRKKEEERKAEELKKEEERKAEELRKEAEVLRKKRLIETKKKEIENNINLFKSKTSIFDFFDKEWKLISKSTLDDILKETLDYKKNSSFLYLFADNINIIERYRYEYDIKKIWYTIDSDVYVLWRFLFWDNFLIYLYEKNKKNTLYKDKVIPLNKLNLRNKEELIDFLNTLFDDPIKFLIWEWNWHNLHYIILKDFEWNSIKLWELWFSFRKENNLENLNPVFNENNSKYLAKYLYWEEAENIVFQYENRRKMEIEEWKKQQQEEGIKLVENENIEESEIIEDKDKKQ